jgi:hypothetical protein
MCEWCIHYGDELIAGVTLADYLEKKAEPPVDDLQAGMPVDDKKEVAK